MMKKNLPSGILPQKQKGLVRLLFNLPAGELNSGHLRKIAEISKRYGAGYISLTLRQNFELPGVPEESVQEVLREMSLSGFYPADRQVLENVVSCPGADQCGLALMKTLGLAIQLDEHLKKKVFPAQKSHHQSVRLLQRMYPSSHQRDRIGRRRWKDRK